MLRDIRIENISQVMQAIFKVSYQDRPVPVPGSSEFALNLGNPVLNDLGVLRPENQMWLTPHISPPLPV
jgi:hypothetical protein